MLPLHAAGIFGGRDEDQIFNYVVSSYTPSLSSLGRARSEYQPIPRLKLRALVVADPGNKELGDLPEAIKEVEVVTELLRSSSVAMLVADPNVNSVLEQLPQAQLLHLACHGVQNHEPLRSHFLLRDEPLSIQELVKLNLPSAVFAFLSACETAQGDQKQPDQTIHLAASLIFCGFRSVIATMW
jgi:CHAT domain-containing protein